MWLCKCDCGNEVVVKSDNLKSGNTKSCGCLQSETASKVLSNANTKHGGRRTRLVTVWYNMKARCYNPNVDSYKYYGGRGIAVCDEWINDFRAFKQWSIDNGYREDLTIDRIDVDGDYCPSNCRWVSQKDQCNNTSRNHLITYNGTTLTMTQWSEAIGVNVYTMSSRSRSGYTDEEILFGKN